MSDVVCPTCGEPWDDCEPDPSETFSTVADRINATLTCPCCPVRP